jgi:hypothetical protein
LQEAIAVVELTIDLGLVLIAGECKLLARHDGSDASEKAVFEIFWSMQSQ